MYVESDGTPKQTYLYFTVDDNYLYGQHDCDNIIMEIEYVDDFTDSMYLNHYQWKNWYEVPVYGGANDKIITGTGSGEVKTAVLSLKNIIMKNTHTGGTDFYLYVPYGENKDTLKIKSLKIKNVSLTPRAHLVTE